VCSAILKASIRGHGHQGWRCLVSVREVAVEPEGSFTLSITSAISGELTAKVSLRCKPAGGSHPNPAAACEQLSKVDGRIEDIPEDPGPCTKEFKPVIVAASGVWCGERRRFEREFGNRCMAVRGTGGVIFDFDSLDQELNPQPEPPG
jgi:hypothetical protein